MKVFNLHGVANENMVFIIKDEADLYRGIFANADNVTELLWQHPPELVLRSAATNQQKYRGNKLRVPDIGHYTPGALLLSQKAERCIGDYCRRFGELSKITVEGETWYHYLVTNVLTGTIDEELSGYCPSGVIKDEVFRPDRLPEDSQIFKTTETYEVSIYFNDNGGETIATLIEQHGLEAGNIDLVWELKTH